MCTIVIANKITISQTKENVLVVKIKIRLILVKFMKYYLNQKIKMKMKIDFNKSFLNFRISS
jgi:hypothetical protein